MVYQLYRYLRKINKNIKIIQDLCNIVSCHAFANDLGARSYISIFRDDILIILLFFKYYFPFYIICKCVYIGIGVQI